MLVLLSGFRSEPPIVALGVFGSAVVLGVFGLVVLVEIVFAFSFKLESVFANHLAYTCVM